MGNSKSKKVQKEPDKLFDREKWKEIKREEKRKKLLNPTNKRTGLILQAFASNMPLATTPPATPPGPGPVPAPAHARSYDDEALDRMRYQLQNDSDAFLLNNILLSVQFFENYEREAQHIKYNSINEREHDIDEAMVRHHKHVYFADRLQECVYEHVGYQRRRGQLEPISPPRLFVIYDNVEASEPGDTSDYSAVLDAPFYKLRIESCKEPGYVKLKKLEVLSSAHSKNNVINNSEEDICSDDSLYTDSERESNDSDEKPYVTKGDLFLHQIQNKLNEAQTVETDLYSKNVKINFNTIESSGRRYSGPVKGVSLQVAKSNIKNIKDIKRNNIRLPEEVELKNHGRAAVENEELAENDVEIKPRKSILKHSRRLSGPTKEIKNNIEEIRKTAAEHSIAEDTETSGYRSNSSSRQNESSETESDYGYSTITECATPKKIELRVQSDFSLSSGVLPEQCWSVVKKEAVDTWSDDEDDEVKINKTSTQNLYEMHYYLNSISFMSNFLGNFTTKLGSALGLTQDAISNALTQGASIYCDSIKNGVKLSYEVYPALIASWPNVADQWCIRERKVIQNPRTNFSYLWPTRNMVRKTREFGCLLIPLGFRPKRGINPDQELQWRIIFPAAERYLESCLAHSHVRCYMFALTLYKTFLENEASKIGIDSSHIKNHLFWQCEDNYAKWPEDRLGETLRMFLRSFYVHFGQARFPNYFMETCNDFKSIPNPLLLKIQRRLADILEAPVMHVLHTLEKLKYMKKDFYPTFNCQRLYQILTCKNPLRILNPNIPSNIMNKNDNSDSEDDRDNQHSFWDRAKAQDKHYLWKKRKHDLIEEKRKTNISRKQKTLGKLEIEINKNIILPTKMDAVRRRLVLEFFIPHFIAMGRSSEKYEAIRQAVIYLEQAQRLCTLLMEEPSGETTAKDYLDVIRDKLADCQRKLVNIEGYKLPSRRESNLERTINPNTTTRGRYRPVRYEHRVSQESPTDSPGIAAFTFVDVHYDNSKNQDIVKLNDGVINEEESKL